MSSSSRKHEETWRLLQPELMTREQLVTILKERNVQIDEESSESEKSHLIGIFRRIVLPLAQRTIFQRQPTLPDLGSIKLGDTSAKNQNHFNSMTTSNDQTMGERVNFQSSRDTRHQLKRSAAEMTDSLHESISNQNSIPKKREKIVWP